jgi:putative oxidoreductase
MIDSRTAPYAATLLRVSLGAMFIAHALILKYFTFTLPGTAQFFESLGLPAALAYATFWAELVGGALLVARRTAAGRYPVFLIAASFMQALLGDGRYALANRFPALNLRLTTHAAS